MQHGKSVTTRRGEGVKIRISSLYTALSVCGLLQKSTGEKSYSPAIL